MSAAQLNKTTSKKTIIMVLIQDSDFRKDNESLRYSVSQKELKKPSSFCAIVVEIVYHTTRDHRLTSHDLLT